MTRKRLFAGRLYAGRLYAGRLYGGASVVATFVPPWGEVVTLSIDTLLTLPYAPGQSTIDYETHVGVMDAKPGNVTLDYET